MNSFLPAICKCPFCICLIYFGFQYELKRVHDKNFFKISKFKAKKTKQPRRFWTIHDSSEINTDVYWDAHGFHYYYYYILQAMAYNAKVLSSQEKAMDEYLRRQRANAEQHIHQMYQSPYADGRHRALGTKEDGRGGFVRYDFT